MLTSYLIISLLLKEWWEKEVQQEPPHFSDCKVGSRRSVLSDLQDFVNEALK